MQVYKVYLGVARQPILAIPEDGLCYCYVKSDYRIFDYILRKDTKEYDNDDKHHLSVFMNIHVLFALREEDK